MHKQLWQIKLSDVITDPEELLSMLELDGLDKSPLTPLFQKGEQQNHFPLRVPRDFAARMKKGDPHDPLLLQVLPVIQELALNPSYSLDPLGEKQANPVPGILHKYQGRVLLTPTGACAIHCRYCFRRHFPYEENTLSAKRLEQILTYLKKDPSLHEVILSGGDPLTLPDRTLQDLIEAIASVPHLRTLRIHTRLPIVIPERITPALLKLVTATRLRTLIIVHCNHPQEIDASVRAAAQAICKAHIHLFNQAVLLKGINDSVECLVKLSHTLFDAGILPYTLNLLDKVQGAAHFEVSEARAKELHWGVMKELPGYLVPRLRKEVPGAPAKIQVPSVPM